MCRDRKLKENAKPGKNGKLGGRDFKGEDSRIPGCQGGRAGCRGGDNGKSF